MYIKTENNKVVCFSFKTFLEFKSYRYLLSERLSYPKHL